MENYKNIQNCEYKRLEPEFSLRYFLYILCIVPNSPLTPLTPLRENRSFNFKFGGDKSLDAYMRDTPFIVNNPVECRSECSGKLTHPSDEFQCIYKKPLESSSNVLNLRSSCASLLPLQFETTAVRHEVVNKSLSPRLAGKVKMSNSSKLLYKNPCYGQVVIGPPGSGKSTYCHAAFNFYKQLDRNVCIVNLDPANENTQYTANINVMQLVTVQDVMDCMKLGPNGALVYCMEFLEKHFDDWFLPAIRQTSHAYSYYLFDCPGQIELYTNYTIMTNIFERLQKEGYHLVTVNLIDSHYCSEPTKFVSTLLMALNSMLRMGLPHINVLSKADILKHQEKKLHFNLDFYTDVLDLKYLIELLDDGKCMSKYKKLNAAICSLIEDYSLVHFQLLNVNSTESMLKLRNHIDKANGYVYRAGEERTLNTLMACAVGSESETYRHEQGIDPYLN